MKKILLIGVGIVLIIVAVVWFSRTRTTNGANQIKTAKTQVKTFIKSIQSSGKTKAKKQAQLKFQTSGKLAWVNVKEGDTVFAGQAVAGLDSREVQKNLENELVDYMKQRNDFEETWRVTYRGMEKPTDALTDTVKRILEKNQWDLNKAVLDVELTHLAVEYATIYSPIAGLVVHIDTPVAGVNITPATSTFEIVDPDSLIFEANVDEIDVGNLTLGQTAEVRLDAFPGASFSGTLSYISYASETSAGGATIFPVEVAFTQAQRLRIGLNGDVSIESARIEDAITVPTEAIREDDTGKYVYKKAKNTYTRRPVTIDLQNDSETVVTSGLVAGDEVVVKGFTNIPQKSK